MPTMAQIEDYTPPAGGPPIPDFAIMPYVIPLLSNSAGSSPAGATTLWPGLPELRAEFPECQALLVELSDERRGRQESAEGGSHRRRRRRSLRNSGRTHRWFTESAELW